MPRRCVVLGCLTNREFYEPGVRFFLFPRDDERLRERWRDAIGRDQNWKIPNMASVCQRHFLQDELTADRRLPDSAVPTVNLPSEELRLKGDNRQSIMRQLKKPSDSPKVVEYRKHAGATRPNRQRQQKKILRIAPNVENAEEFIGREEVLEEHHLSDESQADEEIHLPIETVDFEEEIAENNIFFCRFCTEKLDLASSLDISYLKNVEPVRQGIWDLCMVDCEDVVVFEYLKKICTNCWERMQSFERFVDNCSRQQNLLIAQYSKNPKEILEQVTIKYEPPQRDSDNALEQVIPSKDCSNVSTPIYEAEPLPSLEGLSIDEMIEVLDKIPPRSKRVNAIPHEECWDCGQQFPNRSRKKEHRKTCSAIGTTESLRNKNYKCEICKKMIKTRAGYRVHLLKIHRNQNTAEDNCPDELKQLHARKRLPCPLCPNRFQQVHQLKYHLKTHQSKTLCGTKRRKTVCADSDGTCMVCGKRFQNPFYLETHMKFHLKEKDFRCDQCDKAYYTRHDLNDHKKTVHKDPTLLCGVCGKFFATRRAFTRHSWTHDKSIVSHRCAYCAKAFPDACSLKYHVMKHTGEKSYRCELCGRQFRFRYMMTQHLIRNHNIVIDGVKLYKRKNELQDYEEQKGDNVDVGIETEQFPGYERLDLETATPTDEVNN
ncbi:zinc finger protein 394-like [Topomyia yanbarensis]|uniref:zinc finger protein 394-like n=1 Tax=Topomyia yanbarensis TaxID=2498891 RepID=UPI00273C70B1|nr:zinc finger protein 394-like [Topomyia yanbarensis]XP_058813340.1 zinc finger protein 394-like [Topomyia yanbarensis]